MSRASDTDAEPLVAELVSYAVGCVLGRWYVRFATGGKPAPTLPDPFDPLPACSPGMLQEPDGLPATQNPRGYPLRIDWDGVLVDDPDHPDDIIRRVRDVLEVIFDESLVRSPSSFEGNPPPLEPEDQGPGTRDQGQRTKGLKKLEKEAERLESFLTELRDFEDKLRRAANLHLEPDLNDGVVLNNAPLRELVPWKEAKSYWDDLMDGKYEWSSIGKQLREKGLVSGS